ncbi:nucleotidyl transferase AbiEii/AbiGii toxin family protein [Acidiphilium multivorum]|uniref:nucleotidyl transferase AbiEii/AbiGii toxin family protein n=1 Tax=Acidiphilium multivorum TaxID=62140 RepID=UPI001F4C4F6B|nr:nucleotidyl transferase AbiEii/AbiGii toxin family protein [Acidiphilium multivorum]
MKSVEREMVLKGGFAMRALFGSERRTKDVDLQHDARRATLSRTQTIIRTAIRHATDTGILSDVRVTEPKQTDTVARWKIGGRTSIGSVVNLTIEVSRRPMPGEDCLTRVEMKPQVASDGPLVMVDTYSADAMAGSKTIALLSENRLALRDLYDLDVLISMRAEPPPQMIDHLRNQHARDILFTKLDMMTWPLFQEQVLPSLPAKVASSITQDDFDKMKIRVALTIERWIADPPGAAMRTEASDCAGPSP